MIETVNKAKLLDTIRELAQELGHPPSRDEFQDLAGISQSQVLLHFPSWREALRVCGVESNLTNIELEDKDLLEDWGLFVRKNRHIPTQAQFSQKGKYGPTAFKKHFGTWSAIPLKFKEYAKDKPEWADVLSLLPTSEPKFKKFVNIHKSTKVANLPKNSPRRPDLSLGSD